ncbi:aquaporin-4 isoform X4 [Scyliorhinus canicula]|uniref:aquaporin-4 isoform X4 n=1 Tax=Scyliorhinus canicula TaxID=7830 RepID=UPI0018F5DE3E|nr:aquaporin-4 isoform X4 [Scyliorhinus canicula]
MHRPHQGIEPESQCQTLVHSLAPVTTSHSATVSKHSPLCRCEAAMTAFKGIWTQQFWRAVCGEFLATLIFVLLGTGSTIGCDGKSGPLNIVLISLCFGLSIATMVQCFGHISGGHVNPVVTVAMINENLSVGHGLLVELIITFQLVFTIFATCDPKRDDLKGSAALAIGLSVVIGHLFAINYTGASMNPARSFGPAVITGSWENHWVYWVGPMMGGVIAAVLYKYLFCPDKELRHQLNRSQAIEYKDLVVKPGSSEVIDIDESEEKKEKDATKELLSSV